MNELSDLDLEEVAGGGSAKSITKEAACLFCNMPGGRNKAPVRKLNKAAKQQSQQPKQSQRKP